MITIGVFQTRCFGKNRVVANQKHRCVILADRHQNMLEGIRGLLETVFDSVVMVADRKSLSRAIHQMKPDLAVVDLSLNNSDEESIVHQMSAVHPGFRYIIISVHDDPVAVQEVLSSGATGYVLKRSIATDLLEAVHEVLHGHSYRSPALNV